MTVYNKILILWLCVLLAIFQLSNISSTAVAGTTTSKPQSASPPEVNIPIDEETESSQKKTGKWFLILLGAVLVGGLIVAVMPSDPGSDNDDVVTPTGSYEATW